jgi:hypothetical protein
MATKDWFVEHIEPSSEVNKITWLYKKCLIICLWNAYQNG